MKEVIPRNLSLEWLAFLNRRRKFFRRERKLRDSDTEQTCSAKYGLLPDKSNIEVFTDGRIETAGYKTLRDFIKMLKRQNRVCKKLGISCKFVIMLPIPN